MSRFSDYDDYEGEPEQILAQGRWERNARATLKSKRGRKALRDLREALMALPEHRLIDSAVCTVGGPSRIPDLTDAEIAERVDKYRAKGLYEGGATTPESTARWMQIDRAERREAVERIVAVQGEGVCAVGAYFWHQKVKGGMDPAEAFASIPTIDSSDDSFDSLRETAHLGEEAGLAYTLAWELAYRNDETFGKKTPEQRWEAFVAWIDRELMESVAA